MNSYRSYYIYAAVVLIGLLYILRLLQIQVWDDKYSQIAEKISLRRQTVYPQRGLIFDRNRKLVVYNEPVYDLMVSVPIKLKDIDTLKLDNGVKFMFGETYGLEIEDKQSQVSGLGGKFLDEYKVPDEAEWAFVIVPKGQGD